MNAIALFVATFLLVFVFGFLTRGGYRAAFLTTFAIGVAYLVIFRFLPVITGFDVAGYLLGGPFGIVASMTVQRWHERVAEELTRLRPMGSDDLDQVKGGIR